MFPHGVDQGRAFSNHKTSFFFFFFRSVSPPFVHIVSGSFLFLVPLLMGQNLLLDESDIAFFDTLHQSMSLSEVNETKPKTKSHTHQCLGKYSHLLLISL